MSATVYAWPPVAPSAWEWSVVDPIDASRSLLTGRRYASAAQRRRRVARMSILGHRGEQGGYMEALKRLLQGGAHLVRLTARPMVYGDLPDATARQAQVMTWQSGSDDLDWTTEADPLLWFTGSFVFASISDVGGLPAAALSGLPSSALVGRVGETITVFPQLGGLSGAQTRILLREVRSDASGAAVAVLDAPLTVSGRADIGAETAVFEPVTIPRTMRQVGSGWVYDWEFSEVFEDEVGGFVEVDPW